MNVFESKIVSKDHFLSVTSFAKFIDKNKQRTSIMQWVAFQDANLLSPDSLNNVQRHFFFRPSIRDEFKLLVKERKFPFTKHVASNEYYQIPIKKMYIPAFHS